jgi:WD40 repeat protein
LVSRTWYHQVRSPAVNRRIFTGRWGLYAAGLLRPTPLLDVELTWNGCLAVGPGGEVVTATEDSGSCGVSQTTIKVWTDAAKPPRRFNPGWGQQDDVAISDDRLFSFGIDDPAVNAWSLTDGRKLSFPRIPRVAAPTTWAYGVDVDTRRRRLFTVMRSISAENETYETLDVFSFDGEYEKRVFELESVGKGGIAVMVDGLVAHAARGGVMLWNPDDGSCTTIKVAHVSAIAPAPDGRLAIGALASITIWSPSGVASSTSPMETKGHIKSMACLSDSTLIAAVSLESSSWLDERFQVWSTDSLTLLATIHTAPILQTLTTRSVRLYDHAVLVMDVEASHTGYVYTLGCASFHDITRDTDVMDATFVLKW